MKSTASQHSFEAYVSKCYKKDLLKQGLNGRLKWCSEMSKNPLICLSYGHYLNYQELSRLTEKMLGMRDPSPGISCQCGENQETVRMGERGKLEGFNISETGGMASMHFVPKIIKAT